jgi:hypothetical protein
MWRHPEGCQALRRDHVGMTERDELARMRAEEVADELAVRSTERRMAQGAHELEDELHELEDAEELAEREIEAEWRREHQGHGPEHPPEWRTGKP